MDQLPVRIASQDDSECLVWSSICMVDNWHHVQEQADKPNGHLNSPGLFLSNRRERAQDITRWCHDHHLCFSNRSSADYFRVGRPYGLYPVIFDNSSNRVSWFLALVLSCWRWAFDMRRVPEYCSDCDCMINSWHLMFRCRRTAAVRRHFRDTMGFWFSLECFANEALSDEILTVTDSIYRTTVAISHVS